MAPRIIHHLSRGLIISFEILCAIALLGFILWGALLWRLSQGPMNVNFLAGQINNALSRYQQGFEFTANDMLLAWGGRLEPFEIELRGVHVSRSDHTPVVSIDRAGVQLSKRHLIFGEIAPKVIKLYNPSLRIIRWEDGRVTLNMEMQAPDAAAPAAADVESQTQVLRNFISELQGDSGFGLLKSLQQISVTGADVFYQDKKMNVGWQSRKADLLFQRESEGLSAHGGFTLDMGEGKQAIARADATYVWQTGVAAGNISFSGVIPARLGQQSETLNQLSLIDMPFKGSIDFELERDFQPGAIRFALGADPGTFNAFDFYQQPIPVKNVYIAGHADGRTREGAIDQLKIDLDGPQMEATAAVTTEGALKVLTVNASLVNTPMDSLKSLWPATLTPDPRAWVTENLTKGIADKATVALEMSYDPAAGPGKRTAVRKVGGDILFHGIKVNYYAPLLPVLDVKGRATYDAKSFNLDLTGGKLDDMSVTKSTIRITDLDTQDETHHAHIDIAVALEGPLKTALKVLDTDPPLGYPKKLGIKTADVAGRTSLNVHFKFPLHKSLELDEVAISADARLSDVRLGDIVAGMPLTGGPMDLTVDNGALKVSGRGKLAEMPVTFAWTKNFNENTAFSSHVSAQLPLDGAALAAFGLPADMNVQGTIPAEIDYTLKHNNTAVLSGTGDVSNAAFTIPVAGYRKEAGKKGSLALKLNLNNEKLQSISGLDLNTEDIRLKGDIAFTEAGDFKKAQLADIVLGDSRISLDATGLGAGGYQVRVTGKQLDASSFFKDPVRKTTAEKDAEAAKKSTPLNMKVDVARIITGKNSSLDNVRLSMQRNAWQRIDQLELDATTGGKPFFVRYLPAGRGHTLRVEAENAGATLAAFGIVKSIRGGKLTLSGKTGPNGGPRDLQGMASLTDFTMKDAPVIATLVNAMSLPGIVALLSGEGITFKRARVDYTWTDRGQPDQAKNVRMLKLKDGQTSGASLGLMFEGAIDNWNNVYDMSGTIVPVSGINKLLNVIPIIGTVLTANGEGIIAATYTITGPKEDPTVMVNPLSVLAPGILRKIFFEN